MRPQLQSPDLPCGYFPPWEPGQWFCVGTDSRTVRFFGGRQNQVAALRREFTQDVVRQSVRGHHIQSVGRNRHGRCRENARHGRVRCPYPRRAEPREVECPCQCTQIAVKFLLRSCNERYECSTRHSSPGTPTKRSQFSRASPGNSLSTTGQLDSATPIASLLQVAPTVW